MKSIAKYHFKSLKSQLKYGMMYLLQTSVFWLWKRR